MDDSKESGYSVGAGISSPNLNLNIAHKLSAEMSIFYTEFWAIY